MPTIEELQARIAAQATQVALLHSALRAARHQMLDYGEETAGIIRKIDAALEASEGECGNLFDLARRVARAPFDDDRLELLTMGEKHALRMALRREIDRLEGKL